MKGIEVDNFLPKEAFVIPEHYQEDVSSVLIPHGLIINRIEKIAQDIAKGLSRTYYRLLASVFYADLMNALRKTKSPNHESVQGKHILIVEDIVDTGVTMVALLNRLKNYEPASVRVVSMLIKRTERSNGYRPDYWGFSVPDYFVVGYGLDYNEYFREMEHICIISEVGKDKYKE
ncbi:hypoxanthine-guanine phosphoribosyltransferase [Obelidium mucronatum]|nr:hypoxanthine-guanine phosphoribosyltransferase [Obelidium mucronatum]